MLMCAAVRVKLFYRGGGRRELVLCAAVSVMVCYREWAWKEMVMCAAVNIKVCYMVGETEGNSDVCCS